MERRRVVGVVEGGVVGGTGRLPAWLALGAALVCMVTAPARGADPLVVLSITSGGGTTLCDTNCTTCTVGSGECINTSQTDLVLCRPTSVGLPISACKWSVFLQAASPQLQINNQLRAVGLAPNGNITFVSLNDTMVPDIGNLKKTDIAVLNPTDVFQPFVGGGPYTDGSMKLYLNGDLTQSGQPAKPWDAFDLLYDGTCEKAISATSMAPATCNLIGSLTSGSGSMGLGGVHFNNEDLLRCRPTAWGANGTIEGCAYAMFLDASNINGTGNGITSDIEAIDFLSFTPSTMSGQMVFKMAGGNPPGFPAHDAGKDLLLYDGTFGAGNCVIGGAPCADGSDCASGACNTGSCVIGATSCASDGDCPGSGNSCNSTRFPAATVTKFFDGVAVGLSGAGQDIEGLAILQDADGDGIPDGIDNCPTVSNPPNVCSGGTATCPSGLSSACPMGETCMQADSDGDGVGDACDQCNGRPDPGTCDACPGAPCPAVCMGSSAAACQCGDGIRDIAGNCTGSLLQCAMDADCSGNTCNMMTHVCTIGGAACAADADCNKCDTSRSEQCDLGMQNGVMGSPCSSTCKISGKCKIDSTTLGTTPCTTAADCPSGQGCCGNGIKEANEVCDDGNLIDNDVCTHFCEANPAGTPILGCEDLLGPNIVPAALKLTKFKDTSDQPDIDRWKTKGEAIFATGLTIDPDTENVKIIYNNTLSGSLFQSTLAPGNCTPAPCFVQSGKPTKPKWKFKSKDANVPGSPSWHKGKFSKKANEVKFTLDGRNATLFTAAALGMPPTARQTIRVDDVCITAVIGNCKVKGTSIKCTVLP